MTTKLALYNKALRHIGERPLASLTEDSEPRYLLDAEYDEALLFCLREAYWNFGLRGAKIDASEAITPAFGYQYAVPKPADWVKTQLISPSEFFDPPLRDYNDQTTYWLTNLNPIYVRYISTIEGTTLARFPIDYAEYVGAYLGQLIFKRITQKGEDQYSAFVKETVDKARKNAMANDAMDQSAALPPHGTWVTSRARRGGQTQFPYNF